MKFSLDLDISGAVKITNAIAKQIPFAMAKALTLTAKEAQANVIIVMQLVFDAPTSYTLESTRVDIATKEKLEAVLKFKDVGAAKGTPASKYLQPEIFGGTRNPKRMEKALQRAGLLPSGWFAVPGDRLKLDQYGNITAGKATTILSALKANPDYYANETRKSRLRAIAKGTQSEMFVGTSPTGAQRLAVWERHGRHLWPILMFIDRALSYRPRLRFYDIALDTYTRRYQAIFKECLADAIATARL